MCEEGGWVDWERMARRDASAFEGSVPVFMVLVSLS
jgi:hypothetical protein